MVYKIAIPSHKRGALCKQLISNLKGILPSNIEYYVFIEKFDEEYNFDIEFCKIILTNVKGIQNTRNYIYNYFDDMDKIVCIDDSFTGILKKQGNKLIEFNNYHNLIQIGFNEIIKHKTILFGINISENPFFMSKVIQFGNYAISGKFHGVLINKQILKSVNPYGLAEDQEISLRVSNYFNGVIRFGTFTFNKPKYGKITGGVQDMCSRQQRDEIEKKSYLHLSKKFSHLCSYKSTGIGLKYKKIKNEL